MKKKYSNILFFSYIGILFLIGTASIIYLRIYLKKYSPQQLKHINAYYNVDDLKKIPSFDVVVIKNEAQVALIQSDSFASNISAENLRYSNDTLFISGNQNAKITFTNVKSLIAGDNSEVNLISAKNHSFAVSAHNNAEINIVGAALDDLKIEATDNAEFNLVTSNITNLNLNLQGKNQINIAGRIDNINGYLAPTSVINAFPKPKNLNINGGGEIK